ncbi:hypothetical protein QBC46DRAFT_371261 [Diplogelasinospora grovesii]|uniref:HNH nuclease domain-containing protein n=1 Tax=Diplogelasinospora grovesii TaxID=303347 RepID=A0AAN6NL68_9PEZI|nr:hypothetical protein QBC46DRAFT_371261 [Diplogelasinospora grovesii]
MDRTEALARLDPSLVDQFLGAANTDPDIVRRALEALATDPGTVRCIVSDIHPAAEPVMDYITDIDERCRLFRELQQLTREADPSLRLNATTLAFVMVAPIPEIREYILTVRSGPFPLIMLNVNNNGPLAMRAYLPRGGPSAVPTTLPPMTVPASILNEPGTPNPADDVRRGSSVPDCAKARDGYVCIFAGTGDPEAAHIFPFRTSHNKKFSEINELLQCFWGADKHMAWRRVYENAGITQSTKNYISLNRQLHFWFDHARFALKPLRQTRNEIVVQWHWLKKAILKPRGEIREDQDILVQAGLVDQSWGANLEHRRSGVPIQTGQTFIIRAENPEDLPSFELLELQWNLLRVAAICGAADATDEDYLGGDGPTSSTAYLIWKQDHSDSEEWPWS